MGSIATKLNAESGRRDALLGGWIAEGLRDVEAVARIFAADAAARWEITQLMAGALIVVHAGHAQQ